MQPADDTPALQPTGQPVDETVAATLVGGFGSAPTGQQPTGSQPADDPVEQEPAGVQPTGLLPTGLLPAGGEAAEEQPAGMEPADDTVADDESTAAGVAPTGSTSVDTQPGILAGAVGAVAAVFGFPSTAKASQSTYH
ncbi:hypothetical protein I4F81_000003 [Pyropia yezoensis]|uniref:Uncharacterized protein n=1 Tax=Pyropia yezoensis TaxID=2788 RepID=A0ACC3BHM7_PYRYE|nr:hypothetical protein I4F81_000003 [Neopyropia yezoensis]